MGRVSPRAERRVVLCEGHPELHPVPVSWAESDPVERVAVDEIEGDAPIADQWSIETTATDLYARAGSANPEALAEAAEAEVVYANDLPAGFEGLVLNGRIYVRKSRNRRRMMLALLHELAHWLLGDACSHGDVWCLTLALGAPMPVLKRLRHAGGLSLVSLYWEAELPRWALAARLRMWAASAAA